MHDLVQIGVDLLFGDNYMYMLMRSLISINIFVFHHLYYTLCVYHLLELASTLYVFQLTVLISTFIIFKY